MNVFADLAAVQGSILADIAGQPVTYARGATSVALTAWAAAAPRNVQVANAEGFAEVWQTWDWHTPAAALGALGDPRPGDTITNAAGDVFEVQTLPGTGCFKAGVNLRIHTKQTA